MYWFLISHIVYILYKFCISIISVVFVYVLSLLRTAMLPIISLVRGIYLTRVCLSCVTVSMRDGGAPRVTQCTSQSPVTYDGISSALGLCIYKIIIIIIIIISVKNPGLYDKPTALGVLRLLIYDITLREVIELFWSRICTLFMILVCDVRRRSVGIWTGVQQLVACWLASSSDWWSYFY